MIKTHKHHDPSEHARTARQASSQLANGLECFRLLVCDTLFTTPGSFKMQFAIISVLIFINNMLVNDNKSWNYFKLKQIWFVTTFTFTKKKKRHIRREPKFVQNPI